MNYIKAMNAVDLSRQDVKKKHDKLNHVLNCGEYVVQRKIQGNRMDILFQVQGNKLITRGGHFKDLWLPPLAKPIEGLHGTQLTGEIFHPNYTDNQLAGLLNRNARPIEPEILREIRLYVFDIVKWQGDDCYHAKQIERIGMLMHMQKGLHAESSHIRVLPAMQFNTAMDALKLFDMVVSEGGEGIMLKHKDAIYQPGKRPENTWYKLKKTFTMDVFVIGFNPGEGKYKGMVGSLQCGVMTSHGSTIHMCNVSGFDDKTRIDITDNPTKWRGRVIEVCGFERTSTSMREPRYIGPRDDNSPR